MASERGISNQRCDSYDYRSGPPYGSCCQPKRFKATTDSRQLQSEIQARSPSKDLVAGEHSKDPYARDEWSWVFIPSFLSRCVEVKCASFLGSVERTLRTCPVLPRDHQVWDLCIIGDVSSIQELFRTREISPYAIDSNGTTLLHVSCTYIC